MNDFYGKTMVNKFNVMGIVKTVNCVFNHTYCCKSIVVLLQIKTIHFSFGLTREVERNRKSASLITQSVLIVSIENSFVLALIRSLEKDQKKRLAMRRGLVSIPFLYDCGMKVDWYFLFLTHYYPLKFQYPVINFTLACSLKNIHHGDIKERGLPKI